MGCITRLTALEILDSRGRPTVQATCELEGGAVGTASVPAGASRGAAEARELRDGDMSRYRGLGCRRAVAHVRGEMSDALAGQLFETQAELDRTLIELDGTPDKSRLGANAVLAVSLAFARANAQRRGETLFAYFADMVDEPARALPRPMINLFSGGLHAGGQVPIQDVLLVSLSARSIDEVLSQTYAVYGAGAELAARKYGMRALTADEGGLAPPFPDAATMIEDAVTAIQDAGLTPGRDMALAVDVAASHFYRDGRYHLSGRALNADGMVDQLAQWLQTYPIVSIEDGLAEDDWEHWPLLCDRVGAQTDVVGDDLLCTNPDRLRRAIGEGAANALLLKVNQVGTLTEAAQARALARNAGWSVVVSARSGETEDNWLADLAVGWSGDSIKIGSITQSERLAKYNRLLAIEADTGLPLARWPGDDEGASFGRSWSLP